MEILGLVVSSLASWLELLRDRSRHREELTDRASREFRKAVTETQIYLRRLADDERDRPSEEQLARCWSVAAVAGSAEASSVSTRTEAVARRATIAAIKVRRSGLGLPIVSSPGWLVFHAGGHGDAHGHQDDQEQSQAEHMTQCGEGLLE